MNVEVEIREYMRQPESCPKCQGRLWEGPKYQAGATFYAFPSIPQTLSYLCTRCGYKALTRCADYAEEAQP